MDFLPEFTQISNKHLHWLNNNIATNLTWNHNKSGNNMGQKHYKKIISPVEFFCQFSLLIGIL